MRMRDWVMMILDELSTLSSQVIFSAHETAMMPLIEGCHAIQVKTLSRLNWRSVKDWYSCFKRQKRINVKSLRKQGILDPIWIFVFTGAKRIFACIEKLFGTLSFIKTKYIYGLYSQPLYVQELGRYVTIFRSNLDLCCIEQMAITGNGLQNNV